jgi:hypothetical protein
MLSLIASGRLPFRYVKTLHLRSGASHRPVDFIFFAETLKDKMRTSFSQRLRSTSDGFFPNFSRHHIPKRDSPGKKAIRGTREGSVAK